MSSLSKQLGVDEENLHVINPNKKQPEEITVGTNFYTIGGEVSEDGANVLAKSVTGSRTRFFCKFVTDGLEKGHLVNPWSIYGEARPEFTNAIVKYTGKPYHDFREVDEDTFILYTKYLKSRNDVHYRQAERKALENV